MPTHPLPCARIGIQRRWPAIRPDARINDQIRAREVMLITEDGEKLGIVATREALQRAVDAELDLVEVQPAEDDKPPVCRIYDFKKALYEQRQKQKAGRQKKTVTELKEVKMRVTIDPHDRATKLRHAHKFLEAGHKVKFTLQYRGREVTKPELGARLVEAIMGDLKDIAEVEQIPKQAGKFINLVVTRRKDWKPPKTAPAAAPTAPPADGKAAAPAAKKPKKPEAQEAAAE